MDPKDEYTEFLEKQPGSTHLMYYSERGDVENVIHELTSTTPEAVNTRNRDDNTALIMAADRGHVDIVKLLIQNGAAVNAKNIFEDCALTYAAIGDKHDVVNLLIQNGADIEIRNKYDDTPLILAASHNHGKTVKLLLEKRAKIEARNQYGNTALILAALEGHTETVKLLLDRGADIEARNKHGNTALLLAALKGHTETVKLLIDRGADIFVRNTNLINAWEMALAKKDNDISHYIHDLVKSKLPYVMMEILENKFLDSIKQDDNVSSFHETPLMYAVLYYNHENKINFASTLLSNIDAKDRDGNTALMYAASKGCKEMMDLLINRGANIFYRNRWGNNAADIAQSCKSTEVERILRILMLTTITAPMLLL